MKRITNIAFTAAFISVAVGAAFLGLGDRALVAAPGIAEEEIQLLFIGDVMLDRLVATRSRSDAFYPFRRFEYDGQFFRNQDAVIANLECPITSVRRPPNKEIDFACDSKFVEVLRTIGVTAVSQANNHALDQGRAGLEESRELLRDRGIAVFGDQVLDDPDSSLVFLDIKGKRIALLGFNTTDNALDREAAQASIHAARREADYAIVFMHWGSEYRSQPNRADVELAHWFIDLGADAVIGSHPHWMQTVEVYKNKPIAYSLGNFVFDQEWSRETQYGLSVKLVLRESGNDLELWPVELIRSQPEFLNGAKRQERLDRLAEISDVGIAHGVRSGVVRMGHQ